MQIKSDERVQGVIYKGTRYVRFPFFDPEVNEEFVQWWVRNPLDTLTRVRDREILKLLNSSYSNCSTKQTLQNTEGINMTKEELKTATFAYKGYGRIYTDPENIQDVENILREIDPIEYDEFYPGGSLVASWDDYPEVKYVYKFYLRGDKFKQICKDRNIPVFVFNAGMNQYPSGYYPYRPMSMEEVKNLAFWELEQ